MDGTSALFGTSTREELSAIASASTSGFANAGPATVQSQLFQPGSKQQKRKRNRAILSCQPCHERKQQCDRAKPCSRCLGRGSKDECTYFEHPSHKIQKTGNSGNVNPHNPSLLFRQEENANSIQNALGDIEPTALMGLEALLHLVQASNAVPGPAAHLALTGPAPDRNSQAVHVAAAALSQLSQQATPGTSSTNGPVAEFLQQIRGGGSHPSPDSSGLTDLRSHFPNHAITGHLLYHFFEHSSIPWLWPIIHKPVFDSCYVTFSSGQHPPSFDFIALLAMVCASSLQFLPKTPVDQALFSDYGPGRDVLKKRLYEFSRSILVFNHSLSPSLEHVQALILLAIYQLNEGSLTGYYNSSAASIRMAQSLWMNQAALSSWNLDPLEVEVRRKVWWTLFILDRQQCLILRRPYLIHENHCDIMLPQNDERGQGPQQDPMEQVFLHLQIRWSKLISSIWDKCFSIYSPTYKDIFHIEEDIKRFELDLPSSFHLPTLQVAADHPCVLFQNRTLTLQIYHSRVLILRPFLLIRQVGKDSNPGDEMLVKLNIHARYVCLMICKRLLAWHLIIQNQVDRSQLRWADCVSRIFDTALTIGVAIISNPTHDQNGELDEWISLGQNLLRDMAESNALAPKALQCLDLVRRHTYTISQPSIEPSGSISPSIPITQYLERATQTMAQPQPSMIDLFDAQPITDPMWGSDLPPTYLTRFPNMELCCENVDPVPLQRFINEWSL